MSNGVAPSCPISHSQPTQRTPQPPGVDIATVPHATDLRSVINALRALKLALQNITKGAPQVNNIYPPLEFGFTTLQPFQYQRITWTETSRSYRQQTIVNPDNPSYGVPIKTLVSVTWRESATGHTLQYTGQ